MRSETAAWTPDSARSPAASASSRASLGSAGDGPRPGGPPVPRSATRPFRFGASARPHTDPVLHEGVMLGDRYRIEGRLGEGGMGRVYRARHVFLDRAVAVKVLRSDARTDPESVARFQREALAASRVGHPAIVEVSDFAKLADGQVFLAMELLEGESLEAWLERPSTLDVAVQLLLGVAEGLEAAHEAGVIHRDVKPANVFIVNTGDGAARVKLLDFGIAKMATEHAGGYTTSSGTVLGTPYYLAPERARGEELDRRADVYSLGIILYEVLTGTLPFVGENFMTILGHHMHTAPVDPRQAAPDRAMPEPLARLCLRMLAKAPAHRPLAREVAAALREVLEERGAALAAVAAGARSGVATADVATQQLALGGGGDGVATMRMPMAGVASTGATGPGTVHPGWVLAVAVGIGAVVGLVALELTGGIDLREPGEAPAAVDGGTGVGTAPTAAAVEPTRRGRSGPAPATSVNASDSSPVPSPPPGPSDDPGALQAAGEASTSDDAKGAEKSASKSGTKGAAAGTDPTPAARPRVADEGGGGARAQRGPDDEATSDTKSDTESDTESSHEPTTDVRSPSELKDDIYGD